MIALLSQDRKTVQKEFVNPRVCTKIRYRNVHLKPKKKKMTLQEQKIYMIENGIGSLVHTNKFWQFMRFSEGKKLLQHKNMWRSAPDAWQDLQHDSIQIGTTVFDFNHRGKITEVPTPELVQQIYYSNSNYQPLFFILGLNFDVVLNTVMFKSFTKYTVRKYFSISACNFFTILGPKNFSLSKSIHSAFDKLFHSFKISIRTLNILELILFLVHMQEYF